MTEKTVGRVHNYNYNDTNLIITVSKVQVSARIITTHGMRESNVRSGFIRFSFLLII